MDDSKTILRSEIMKKVKPKGNKTTELEMIKLFREHNVTGWRRYYSVKGHPDFVFLKERVAIFVDGCFWHGHNCRNTHPTDNAPFWEKKRSYNIKHDITITELFQSRGWTVLRIWECELKIRKQPETIKRILSSLGQNPNRINKTLKEDGATG